MNYKKISKFLRESSVPCLPLILIILLHPIRMEARDTDTVRWIGAAHATFSSGKNTPFWLVNNLQGLGSVKKNNGYIRAAAFRDPDKSKRFSWGAGIDLVGAWRSEYTFNIHQLYGEVSFRSLSAMLGSKEIAGDFNNPRLSSGNPLYSGNAMPVPQLRAGIFDYADIWGTKGWLAAKGYLAYGMFSDSKWQESWANHDFKYGKNVWFHSKGLWLRGGNPDRFPLSGEIGIEMATQFGGTVYVDGVKYKNHAGLKDFLKAFFPKYETEKFMGSSVHTVEGNMLGTYDFSLSWTPKADWGVKAYFQHFFEDESQMTFQYGWKDGLWGIEIDLPDNPVVGTFVYEYLRSKDQTGPVLWNSNDEIPEQVSGRDDYYNHHKYGWQHWGMGIGNPLIISPVYNDNGNLYFYDNRIVAHHFGIEGNPIRNLSYRMLMSFSRNWGTYQHQFPDVIHNFNWLLEASWRPGKFEGWFLTAGVAADAGKLLGKSFGVSLTVGKTGFLSF